MGTLNDKRNKKCFFSYSVAMAPSLNLNLYGSRCVRSSGRKFSPASPCKDPELCGDILHPLSEPLELPFFGKSSGGNSVSSWYNKELESAKLGEGLRNWAVFLRGGRFPCRMDSILHWAGKELSLERYGSLRFSCKTQTLEIMSSIKSPFNVVDEFLENGTSGRSMLNETNFSIHRPNDINTASTFRAHCNRVTLLVLYISLPSRARKEETLGWCSHAAHLHRLCYLSNVTHLA